MSDPLNNPPRRPRWLARALALAGCAALALALAGCAGGGAAAGGPLPRFAEYEDYEVRRVRFAGELLVPRDSLRAIITTQASRCRLLGLLPVCLFGLGREEYELDLQELARDVIRIQLYYRDHGFYGSRVVPSVDPLGDETVAVRFAIAPGDRVVLRDLDLEGVGGVLDEQALAGALPLEVGSPFRRSEFLQAADTIRSALLRRGYAYADVLRNYSIDTIADVAEAQFVALPGPRVYVDTVVVEGTERLSDETIREQVTLREGELLRVPALAVSQRNVYGLDMVEFATVQIAPDSVEVTPDSALATVLVRVAEGPQYVADAALGFGTVDCVRTQASWLNRNFLGGGRQLELSGRLSRIGAAEPVDLGFGDSVCDDLGFDEQRGEIGRQLRETARQINYRAAISFKQPRLFSARTQLTAVLQSERVVELGAFVRESSGAQLGIIRPLDTRTVLSATADVENGRTLATPEVLCVGFDTCNERDLELLIEPRWSNFVALSAVRDATVQRGLVTGGYTVRGGVDWASGLFGSDNEYVRTLLEGSYYRPLRPGWVLSANLRGGRFFQGSLNPEGGYIPPERRFYAGGPNSVRGFARNTLGPTVYVIRRDVERVRRDGVEVDSVVGVEAVPSATGGTQLVAGSVELRTPSPWLADLLRLAAFVDAGTVTAPGSEVPSPGLRVTPGAGVRVQTPVGPFRLDVAYRPYPESEGLLYDVTERGLFLLDDDFQPPEAQGFQRFLERLQVTLAFGQAF